MQWRPRSGVGDLLSRLGGSWRTRTLARVLRKPDSASPWRCDNLFHRTITTDAEDSFRLPRVRGRKKGGKEKGLYWSVVGPPPGKGRSARGECPRGGVHVQGRERERRAGGRGGVGRREQLAGGATASQTQAPAAKEPERKFPGTVRPPEGPS